MGALESTVCCSERQKPSIDDPSLKHIIIDSPKGVKN
jgi:hypothetical protein